MNEQINQLYQQALEFAYKNVNKAIWNTDNFHAIVAGKFAELIVRECVEELRYTVLDTQELRRDKSTDYQVGWEDGMFDAEEMIKAHFGVEE